MSAPEIERRAAPSPREMAPPPSATRYNELAASCFCLCGAPVIQLSVPAQVDAAAVG